MAYDGYECLKIRIDRHIAFVTIDHPPIVLLTDPILAGAQAALYMIVKTEGDAARAW